MYGRPPATWLISESIQGKKELTFNDIALKTKEPIKAVRRLCEKYTEFLRLKHVLNSDMLLSNAIVNVKRMSHLHAILAADRVVRIQMGRYEAGHPHTLSAAFAKMILVAKKSGLQTSMRAPRDPEKVKEYREKLLARLKIPFD